MEYIYFFIFIVANALVVYFTVNIKRVAQNDADILQNRDKEYESEKGKNLATKEDIEEITQKIEQVKAEISFRSQWEQEHIVQREKRLENILYLAQKISMTLNKIVVLSKNAHNVDDLFHIINEVNDDSVELTHEGNLILVDYKYFKELTKVSKLVDNATLYAGELSCLANNIANALQASEMFKNMALEEKDDKTAAGAAKKSVLMISQVNDYLNSPLKYKELTKTAINEYILWFEQKKGDGSLLQYRIKQN